jgi:hypothetical protein
MLAIIQSKIFYLPVSYQKIKIYKTNFASCAVWVQTLSFTLREEHRLGVFENSVLKRIFGPKRVKMDCGENCIMMNFTTCILHRILLG